MRPQPDGALHLRGDLRLVGPDDDEITREPRLALCRCGRSGNEPFCDHSHADGDPWRAPGGVAADALSGETVDTDAPLEVRAGRDGPLLLRGPFSLRSADGATVRWGEEAALCRCGGSSNRPFCDGTHARIGFRDGASGEEAD